MRSLILVTYVTALCDTPEQVLECERICAAHHGTLLMDENGVPSCLCTAGYTPAESSTCVDIDECALEIDSCPRGVSNCVNTDGSYYCTCDPGWIPSPDGRTCHRVNPCDARPCGNKCCKPTMDNREYICAAALNAELESPICPAGFQPPSTINKWFHSKQEDYLKGGLFNPQFLIDVLSLSHRNLMNVLNPLFESSITPAIATFIASKALNPPIRTEVQQEARPRRSTTTTTPAPPTTAPMIAGAAVVGTNSKGRQQHSRHRWRDDDIDDLLIRLLADDERSDKDREKGERMGRDVDTERDRGEKKERKKGRGDETLKKDLLAIDGLSEAAIIALLSSREAVNGASSGGRRRNSNNNPQYSSLDFAIQQANAASAEDAEFHIDSARKLIDDNVFDLSTMNLSPF